VRNVTIFAALLTLLLLTASMAAQDSTRSPIPIVYGRLIPRTFEMPPVIDGIGSDDTDVPPPLTTFTGKFVVTFTITISSAVPTSTTIACNVGVIVIDAAGDISDSLATTATRSGSTATCSVTLPYSWAVSAQSDTVYVSYDVSAPPQPLVST